MEPASSEAKRAGRICGHHTTGLLDSQAALSLVDLFSWVSWVSRCIQAVSSSGLQEVMTSSHVFDRAFGRSVVRWRIDGSPSVAVTSKARSYDGR